VLVTGASGFIGSAVVAALARDGYAVRAAVRRPHLSLPDGVEVVQHPDLAEKHSIGSRCCKGSIRSFISPASPIPAAASIARHMTASTGKRPRNSPRRRRRPASSIWFLFLRFAPSADRLPITL
jgi:NAD(P)-dependent dehydrogenase (short-subunit alcohol dehydrogenase family)